MPWGQIVPSLRIVAKIATGRVARLAIDDFGHNASHEVMVNRP
jgi:hypothetical protein